MPGPRTVSYACQGPFHDTAHISEGHDMIRTSKFCGRTMAGLAAIACAFGLAAAGVTLAAGIAAPPARTSPARHVSSPSAPSGRAGLVLDIDPPTAGQRGTFPAERDPSITRSTDGLVLQVLPDGSRRVNLQGRFRAYSAVAIASDGALRMACADDQAAALALAHAAAAHAPTARAHRVAFGPGEE